MVVPTPSLQSTLPANAVPADLVRIVDGDTIVVRIKGESGQETVRLIGIDTPETKKPNTPVQCYGKEATAFTTKLLTGKKIWLESDKSNRDQYGRLLRYVWVENGSSYLCSRMKKSSLLDLELPATIRPTRTITIVSSPPSTTRARTSWEYGDRVS